MTKEKKFAAWVIVVLTLILSGSVYLLGRSIQKAGGIKGIAVTVGKEVKDIAREIAEEK